MTSNILKNGIIFVSVNDNPNWKSFRGGKISEKYVEKAREALKIYHGDMDEFQSKILTTKRDSNEAYMKMMDELKNPKINKKSTFNQRRTLSRISNSFLSNPELFQMQTNINTKLEENKQNIEKLEQSMETVQIELKKLSETQDAILKLLKEAI